MGWGTDPDTLSHAMAVGAANRTGAREDTADWWETYRSAYDPVGDGEEYFARIDAIIIELRQKEEQP